MGNSSERVYPDVDHRALGEDYIRHVGAMTAEGLHDKGDIAAQLAWRDQRITALERERDGWEREARELRHTVSFCIDGGEHNRLMKQRGAEERKANIAIVRETLRTIADGNGPVGLMFTSDPAHMADFIDEISKALAARIRARKEKADG